MCRADVDFFFFQCAVLQRITWATVAPGQFNSSQETPYLERDFFFIIIIFRNTANIFSAAWETVSYFADFLRVSWGVLWSLTPGLLSRSWIGKWGNHTGWKYHCLSALSFAQSRYWWVCSAKEGGLLSQQGNTNVQNGYIITKTLFHSRANILSLLNNLFSNSITPLKVNHVTSAMPGCQCWGDAGCESRSWSPSSLCSPDSSRFAGSSWYKLSWWRRLSALPMAHLPALSHLLFMVYRSQFMILKKTWNVLILSSLVNCGLSSLPSVPSHSIPWESLSSQA